MKIELSLKNDGVASLELRKRAPYDKTRIIVSINLLSNETGYGQEYELDPGEMEKLKDTLIRLIEESKYPVLCCTFCQERGQVNPEYYSEIDEYAEEIYTFRCASCNRPNYVSGDYARYDNG